VPQSVSLVSSKYWHTTRSFNPIYSVRAPPQPQIPGNYFSQIASFARIPLFTLTVK